MNYKKYTEAQEYFERKHRAQQRVKIIQKMLNEELDKLHEFYGKHEWIPSAECCLACVLEDVRYAVIKQVMKKLEPLTTLGKDII